MAPDKWAIKQQARTELEEQTAALADILEAQGIPARLKNDITSIGLVTGKADSVESYRAIRFLPLVAQRDRLPMLNDMRYYHEKAPQSEYIRFLVVTAGERIPAGGDLRAAIQQLARNISRWASEANTEYGIETVFRGTEFTIDDKHTFHVHANVLYKPTKRLSKEKFSQFLIWSRRRLGKNHIKDNGQLLKPQEAIKYPFKPTDVMALATTPEKISWLYHQTKRLKMMQPMGAFKEFRAELSNAGEKIASLRTTAGPRQHRVKIKQRYRTAPNRTKSTSSPPENLILTETLPQFRHVPWAEPCLLVQGYTESPQTDAGRRGLERIVEARKRSFRYWQVNGGPTVAKALKTADIYSRATRQNVLPFHSKKDCAQPMAPTARRKNEQPAVYAS